jgi:hypothetical protein
MMRKLPLGDADDVEKLSGCIRKVPRIGRPYEYQWPNPVLRLIDCVLSLNRRYDSFVVPRVRAFQEKHPEVKTLAQLQTLISTSGGPAAFFKNELDCYYPERADIFLGVLHYLASILGQYPGSTELERLATWAMSVQPSAFREIGVYGFGLSGFQYLRMLFGADTTKPDRHIRSFVKRCIGEPVSDWRALQLMEHAAKRAGRSLREVDHAIWESYARNKTPRRNKYHDKYRLTDAVRGLQDGR